MNRFPMLAAASLFCFGIAAHADTVLNLNATTGNASTSYGGGYNTLAPSFYQTITLGAGTYTVSAIGAGVTGSNGVTSLYNGFSFDSTGSGPGPNSYQEKTGFSYGGGSFTASSSADGYQNSYVVGSTSATLFSGAYASSAAALAATSPYTFTLSSSTAVTFYASDDSFAPTGDMYGYDDNTGGVSLDVKAVTPEPSSLVLLGTGALSLAGAVRRRLTK